MERPSRRCFGLMVALWLLSVAVPAVAQTSAPATEPATVPERWEEAIAAFEATDRAVPPPADAVLFIGSSSIRGWKLEQFFPSQLPTINRGFGGSQISDSLHYVGRIVLPYRPRIIVFYAGENDIAAGETPEQVAADFQAFVARVRAELPQVKIIFIGLKPSPSRWRLIDHFRQTNRLIRDFVQSQPNLVFVDVEPAMLDESGRPREELFLRDRLHMTRAGYELWTELLRPHLDDPESQR